MRISAAESSTAPASSGRRKGVMVGLDSPALAIRATRSLKGISADDRGQFIRFGSAVRAKEAAHGI
jgi:hypothetical protein